MSEQVEKFKSLISALQQDRNNEYAVNFIRCVCVTALTECPIEDLISIALFIVQLDAKASKEELRKN